MKSRVLITGCSTGIGYDTAHTLHKRGWRVFATCRKQEDCARLQQEGLESFVLDYENPDTIKSAVATLCDLTDGKLDVLINNGAYAIPGAVEDLPTDALRTIFEANFFGWHDLTTQLIPLFRQQGHGRIIQVSSVLGFVTMPMRGSYQATKFALEGLTHTMRLELEPSNIRVVLIEPGPIDTPFRQNALQQFKKWIKPENSVWAQKYAQMQQPERADSLVNKFELPAAAVTQKIIHAVENKYPKARYYVTTPTYIMGIAKRVLPIRLLDKLCTQT